MLTGKPPFHGATQKELFENILGLKINYPKDFSKLAKDLVGKLLKTTPKDRISLKAASEHPWFKNNPPIRPVLTRKVEMEKKLPTLEHDPEESDFEPVSRVSKVNREETKKTIQITIKQDFLKRPEEKKSSEKQHDHIEDLGSKLEKATKEISSLKALLQSKMHEMEVLKKENDDIKLHIGTSPKGYISLEMQEKRKMNEEIQKLRAANKSREALLVELEKKTTQVTELEAKNGLQESEINGLKENKKILDEKVNEIQGKLDQAQKNNVALKVMLREAKMAKEKQKAELDAKMEDFQNKSISKHSLDVTAESEVSLIEVAGGCKKLLEEIKERIKKEALWKKTEEAFKKEIILAHKTANELKIKQDKELSDFQNSQDRVMEELKSKITTEKNEAIKKKERQVDQLLQQLAQFEMQEGEVGIQVHNIKSLQSQNAILQRMNNDLKVQIGLLTKEHETMQSKIKAGSNKIQDLEMQNSNLSGKLSKCSTEPSKK